MRSSALPSSLSPALTSPSCASLSSSRCSRLLLAVVLSLLLPSCQADVFQWRNEEIQPNKLKVRSFIEMYTKDDSPMPFWSSAAAGDATVSVDLRFTAINNSIPAPNAQIEVAVFKATHGAYEYTFPYKTGEGETVTTSCCAGIREMAPAGACENDQSLFIDPTYARDISRWTVKFVDGKGTLKETHVVNETGEHFLIIADCTSPQSATVAAFPSGVAVDGQTRWHNPYGHLMGRLYGYLPFYAIMSLLFLTATALWFSLNIVYRASLASVQHCISVVLTLCLVESVVWFLDYYLWNASGQRNMPLIVAAILLTVSRLSLSRMLVVAVALGWGVVRPSLGKNRWKLVTLGLVYFMCESGLEMIQRYGQIDSSVERWRIALIIPVSVLNSVFYWWMFLSLHRLLVFLDGRKQLVKLHIYRQLTVVLIASLILAVLYAGYQIYFTVSQQQMSRWSSLWLLDQGIPFMIYTLILLSIALLWRPSAEGKQYQYSQLQGAEGDQDDGADFAAMEKNERGEAGDSDDEDEEDAGLDDDDDTEAEDEAAQAAAADSEQPHVQKLRAQFSIGGDDEQDADRQQTQQQTQQQAAAGSVPLLTAPSVTGEQPVTIAVNGGKPKVGKKVKKSKTATAAGNNKPAEPQVK